MGPETDKIGAVSGVSSQPQVAASYATQPEGVTAPVQTAPKTHIDFTDDQVSSNAEIVTPTSSTGISYTTTPFLRDQDCKISPDGEQTYFGFSMISAESMIANARAGAETIAVYTCAHNSIPVILEDYC